MNTRHRHMRVRKTTPAAVPGGLLKGRGLRKVRSRARLAAMPRIQARLLHMRLFRYPAQVNCAMPSQMASSIRLVHLIQVSICHMASSIQLVLLPRVAISIMAAGIHLAPQVQVSISLCDASSIQVAARRFKYPSITSWQPSIHLSHHSHVSSSIHLSHLSSSIHLSHQGYMGTAGAGRDPG